MEQLNYYIPHSKPYIDESDVTAVCNILRSGHLEEGASVEQLELWFKNSYGSEYACAVSSGFAAILLSLIALNVDNDSEVIIPSYVCQAVLNPIRILGAKPVIVDVCKDSFNIDVSAVRSHITTKTKAIIVPHIFGFPAKIDKIKNIGVPIIEDCSQSLGGEYNGLKLGQWGDIAVFSFFATKMIASGDGGMVITNNKAYAEKILNYRYYGHKKMHQISAYNFHLTNIPAALALSQLKKLPYFLTRRKEIAGYYDRCLSNILNVDIQFENKLFSCYYRYPVRVTDANKMIGLLKSFGVNCGYGVLDGMHQIMNKSSDAFINTEYNLKTIISIPIYPSLQYEEMGYVINQFKNNLKYI